MILSDTSRSDLECRQAMFSVGEKAVYPGQGPCRISRVVKKTVGDRVMMFYHLIILSEAGGELFVPIDKAEAIGLRLLLKRSEIPKLLDRLKKTVRSEDGMNGRGITESRLRAIHNQRLLNSGSAFDLAELIESLTDRSNTKALNPSESHMLDKARRLLICEISEVLGETTSAVAEQIDTAIHQS